MLFILLSLLVVQSNGRVWCVYSSIANTVQCSNTENCSTVNYDSPLPYGKYKVGPETTFHSGGWLNLYPLIGDAGGWDYHTKIPYGGCRGGFGLHEGTQSLGCITVTDKDCWNSIYNAITRSTTTTQGMSECLNCIMGWCMGGKTIASVDRIIYDVSLEVLYYN
eukprot:190675_1